MSRTPKWLWKEGLIYVGMWEPIYFLKQTGNGCTNIDAIDAFRHTEAFVDALHSRGVNHLWTHFWKGYGLKFEREQIERNRDLARWCHDRDMRLIAYCTFGSVTPEALLLEEPEAEGWLQVGEHGQWASYGAGSFQCFRAKPCYNSQGWLDYMKKVVALALEIGCDGIHFDNVHDNAEPDKCRCRTCVEKFRQYLTDRYGPQTPQTRAAGLARFGHNDFSQTRPPWFNRFNQAVLQRKIQVALHQEWVQFRTDSLAGALQQMADHIHALKPEALVEANCGGATGANSGYHSSRNAEVNFRQVDLLFDESARSIGVGLNGQTLTRMREHKQARAADKPAILYSRDDPTLAETFAFNPGSFANGGDTELNAWYHKYKRYQLDARTLSEVAVLRHWHTLTYNSVEPYLSAITVEQVLIENRIAWDMVWASHLDDLSKYRLLILPDVECLSDDEAARIVAFVQAGGAVLATEQTGVFDNWRRRRQVTLDGAIKTFDEYEAAHKPLNALHELFGADPSGDGDELRRRFDDGGRACYLSKIEYAVWPPSGPEFWAVFPEHYAMPKNADQILSAIEWCMDGRRRLRVESAQRVVVEHTQVGDEELIHLLHVEGPAKKASATVTVRPQRRVRRVLAAGLRQDPAPIEYARDGENVLIDSHDFETYKMILLR